MLTDKQGQSHILGKFIITGIATNMQHHYSEGMHYRVLTHVQNAESGRVGFLKIHI